MLGILVGAIAIGALLALLISRSIVRPLTQAGCVAETAARTASVEELSASAAGLSAQADELNRMVARFTVEPPPPAGAPRGPGGRRASAQAVLRTIR